MKHSGDQHVAIVPVIDDVILDADRANAGSELRTETSHPGLFRQEVKAVDDVVDEPVSGSRARVLGDIQTSSRSCSARDESRYGISGLRRPGCSASRLDPFSELSA